LSIGVEDALKEVARLKEAARLANCVGDQTYDFGICADPVCTPIVGQSAIEGVCQCPATQQPIDGNTVCGCKEDEEFGANLVTCIPICTGGQERTDAGACECPSDQKVVDGSCVSFILGISSF
jgi:hypothetical protein